MELTINLSILENNKKHIATIQDFAQLPPNWDTYNANKPSLYAIAKAINFAKYLSDKNIDIFFTAPTPDGDVLIELKNKDAYLEFIFSEAVEDKIIAAYNGDFHTEAILNDTTLLSYLKWLTTQHGKHPDF